MDLENTIQQNLHRSTLTDYLSLKMDKMSTPLSIFLYLSKAFDTLNHKIVLSKLQHYGINGISYNLLNTYL